MITSSSSSSSSSRSSSSSSSSSTQRLARGPVDETHVFQKKVFSPRPEASFEVYFNAKTHRFKLRFKKNKKKVLSPRRDAPFRVYFNATQTPFRSAAKVMQIKQNLNIALSI